MINICKNGIIETVQPMSLVTSTTRYEKGLVIRGCRPTYTLYYRNKDNLIRYIDFSVYDNNGRKMNYLEIKNIKYKYPGINRNPEKIRMLIEQDQLNDSIEALP